MKRRTIFYLLAAIALPLAMAGCNSGQGSQDAVSAKINGDGESGGVKSASATGASSSMTVSVSSPSWPTTSADGPP